MSRICQLCDRGPTMTATRSHSNIKNKKLSSINLQYASVDGKRVRVCNTCRKTITKQK